jgi:hypothetical protein
MYDNKKDKEPVPPLSKKNMKVAFGHAVASNDKKKVSAAPPTAASSRSAHGGRNSLGGGGGGVAGKSAMKMQSSPDLSLGKAKAGARGGGDGGGGGGLNGFAKLQLKAAKGPQIVTYEDEGPSAPRGGGRGRHGGDGLDLELKGQSKYMPIRDDDDYPSVGGDQLDRLLGNAKRGKFG